MLCQNSNLNLIEDEWQSVGDPTDSACAVFGWKLKESVDSYRRSHPRFREFTFDRTRKRMTTIHEFDGERWAFSKGALGPFMGIATHIYEDGKIVPLEGRHKDIISEINLEYASRALRVLALCARRIPDDIDIDSVEAVEDQMIFLGLVGIMDPPRPEVNNPVIQRLAQYVREQGVNRENMRDVMNVIMEIGREYKASTEKSSYKPNDENLGKLKDAGLSDETIEAVVEVIKALAVYDR